MQQRERHTPAPRGTRAPVGSPAPAWVLALGAALLLMALALTVYGPRTVTPASTRSVGVTADAGGN